MSFDKKPQNIPQAGVPTFRYFCQKVLPAVYDDSLSYYELLCKLTAKINEVIETQNTQVDAITELQDLYNDLVNYVNTYFDNLDVQTEINNKLDQMAKSGELAEIVTAYLQVSGVLGFNDINSLKSATNLVNGSFVMTYGKDELNDGYPLLYKIRTIISSDVVDNYNIVSLTNFPTLIAEKITIEEFNTLDTKIDTTKTELQEEIDTTKTELQEEIDNTKLTEMVVFGDSWSDLDVTDSIWSSIVANSLNLTLHNYAQNGAGFVQPVSNLFSTQVDTFINDNSYQKNKIRQIIFFGGINDYRNDVTYSQLQSAIKLQIERVQEVCPNAKILYISNCQYPYTPEQTLFWVRVHERLTTNISADNNKTVALLNLNGQIGMALFNTNNYFHLTQIGYRWLATQIISCLNGGKFEPYMDYRHLQNSTINVWLNTYINNTVAHICGYFVPKTATNNFTVNINSGEANLCYSETGNTFPIQTGISFVQGVMNINSDNIVIACSDNLRQDRNYYFSFDYPVTH